MKSLENGKPSSTEYMGSRSLHQREGPEKRRNNRENLIRKISIKKLESTMKKTQKWKDIIENGQKPSTSVKEVNPESEKIS